MRLSARDRGLLLAGVVLLVAIWVLKTGLKLAGGAIRVILLVVLVLVVIGWVTRKVGRPR